jgi:hypothetical protein
MAQPKNKTPDTSVNEASVNAGYEVSDADTKRIFWFGSALLLGFILIQLGLGTLFFTVRRLTRTHLDQHHPAQVETSLLHQRKQPPLPRLQANPTADLRNYLDRENQLLSSYAWIDRKAGIARIPIERAMELVIKNGKYR